MKTNSFSQTIVKGNKSATDSGCRGELLYLSRGQQSAIETVFPSFQLQTSLLMIDCGTAGWPTVQQVSRRHRLPLWATRVTACHGAGLLSGTVINDSISLDMMGALSRLHWQIALTFLLSVCVCVCIYLQTMRELKHLSFEAQQRSCPTI